MYDISAGKFTRSTQNLDQYFNKLKQNYSQKLISPGPKTSTFSIDALFPPSEEISGNKPVKVTKSTAKPSTPTHRRQPSVIIKHISEIYSFSSTLDCLNKELVSETSTTQPKNSIFASTTDLKSSCNSYLKKSCSEVEEEFIDNEHTETAEICDENTKNDNNISTVDCNTQEEIPENFIIGILPKKIYCSRCELDTTTKVSLKLPTLPFWKMLCCTALDFCTDPDALDKYQEFQHKCKVCNTVLATGYPVLLL
jgi:LITAF-like zinc ribbon domain